MAAANIPQELRSLPLDYIIASPLVAAVKAQGIAAMNLVEFINEVCFEPKKAVGDGSNAGNEPELKARTIEFEFDRAVETETSDADGTTTTSIEIIPHKLKAPLMAILPMPYIRIRDLTIDFEFHVKEVDTEEKKTQQSVSTSLKSRFPFFKVQAKGAYSTDSAQKRDTDRRTTLKIHVYAVQDEIPAGLGRLLDILNDGMSAVPLK